MLSPFKTSEIWLDLGLGVCVHMPVYAVLQQMSACYSYSLHGRIAIFRLFRFLHMNFSSTPKFDLGPDYIIRKGIRQRIYLHREILSTYHTRVDNRPIRHFCIVFTPKRPFPFDDHHQNLIHSFRPGFRHGQHGQLPRAPTIWGAPTKREKKFFLYIYRQVFGYAVPGKTLH